MAGERRAFTVLWPRGGYSCPQLSSRARCFSSLCAPDLLMCRGHSGGYTALCPQGQYSAERWCLAGLRSQKDIKVI